MSANKRGNERRGIRYNQPMAVEDTNDAIVRLHCDYLRRSGATDDTLYHRRANLRRLAAALSVSLLDATPDDLTDWQSATSKRVSLSSTATYSSHTRAFYTWAVQAGHLDADPSIRLARTRVPIGRPRPIPIHDLDIALAAADEPLFTWLVLGAFMGLRRGDIAGIRGSDIVEGEVDGEARLFLTGIGKGRKSFSLPVPEDVEPILQQHRLRGPRPLWLTKRGRPVTRRYVSDVIGDFFVRLGMPWTTHNLRHTFGTLVQRETRDMLQTQVLMRHASLNTTRLYVEPVTAPGVAAMDRLAHSRLAGRRRRHVA